MTKIQLNSKEALERLIGEDKELEFSIKNAIVNEFATKYLKGVAHSEIMQNAKLSVERYLRETDFCGLMRMDKYRVPIPLDPLKEIVRKAVNDTINEVINEEMAKYAEDYYIELKSSIEKTVRDYLPQLTVESIKTRSKLILTKMLDEL